MINNNERKELRSLLKRRGNCCSYVGVSSRAEFLDAAVGANVFDNVTEGGFVMYSTTG